MSPRLRSTIAILIAFIVPLGVYVASLRGDVSYWDTGDFQTVTYIAGIAYPTGFPGYTLIGWLWTHVFVLGNVAWRVNLLSALAAATTSALLVRGALALGVGSGIALAAGLIFASGDQIWSRATYADAHPVGFAFVVGAFVCALLWLRDGTRRAGAGAVLLAAAAVAVDNTTVLEVAGVAILLGGRRASARAVAATGAAALAIVVLTYAYLPIRSAAVWAQRLDPTLALGIAPGRPFWDDHHPVSPAGFLALVTGSEFNPHGAALHMFDPAAYHRLASDFLPSVENDCGALVLWLAFFGAVVWWWHAPRTIGATAAFGLVPLLFIFAYPVEADVGRYYPPAYLAALLAAAYGAQAIARALRPPLAGAAGITGLVALAGVLGQNIRADSQLFDQRYDRGAADFIERVARVTRDGSVLVVPWMYATPLAYGAYVTHRLGTRIVLTANAHDFSSEYRRWSRDRPVVVISDGDQTFGGLTATQLDAKTTPRILDVR